jgi:hypothetical protein
LLRRTCGAVRPRRRRVPRFIIAGGGPRPGHAPHPRPPRRQEERSPARIPPSRRPRSFHRARPSAEAPCIRPRARRVRPRAGRGGAAPPPSLICPDCIALIWSAASAAPADLFSLPPAPAGRPLAQISRAFLCLSRGFPADQRAPRGHPAARPTANETIIGSRKRPDGRPAPAGGGGRAPHRPSRSATRRAGRPFTAPALGRAAFVAAAKGPLMPFPSNAPGHMACTRVIRTSPTSQKPPARRMLCQFVPFPVLAPLSRPLSSPAAPLRCYIASR